MIADVVYLSFTVLKGEMLSFLEAVGSLLFAAIVGRNLLEVVSRYPQEHA